MSDEWSLKGKKNVINDIVPAYSCEDIETLRQKLIEDFSKDGLDASADYFPPGSCIEIINKRFGVEEKQ